MPRISEARFANPHEAHTTGGQDAALNAPKGTPTRLDTNSYTTRSLWLQRQGRCRRPERRSRHRPLRQGQVLPQLRHPRWRWQLLRLVRR